MLCFPNCKINLGLYVTGKRSDGYHNIETLFYPVSSITYKGAGAPLNDVLEIVPGTTTQLHLSGLAVSGNELENLVMKGYKMLRERFPDKVTGLDIYLHKTIPMGAGLGGGSADGAFVLRLMNDYFKLHLTAKELAGLALQLGSDCPFFIYNSPQFASGRGEELTPADLDLSAYSIQIICPKVHVSTAKAFAMMQPKPAGYDLSGLSALPIEQWTDCIANDFEIPVFSQHPVLASIKQQLYDQGAVYASMSGSGSAIYGIFEKGRKAEVRVEIDFEEFLVAT